MLLLFKFPAAVQAATLTQREQHSHVLRHSEASHLTSHQDGNPDPEGVFLNAPTQRSKALLRKVEKRATLKEVAQHVIRLNAFGHLLKKVRGGGGVLILMGDVGVG